MRLLIALITIMTIAFSCINTSFKVTYYDMNTEKSIDTLRIVFVSDLHLKEYGYNNEKLLNTIKELNPSIIAVGGDAIISNIDDHDSAIRFLEGVSEIAPTYFSLGNHEWTEICMEHNTNLVQRIKDSGVVYLENDLISVNISGNDIVICGIIDNLSAEYGFTDSILTEFNNEKYKNSFKILLSHIPVMILNTDIEPNADIVLSGHEHGGQVIIPIINRGLYSRNQGWFPEYTSGVHTIANNTVIISTGLSNSYLKIPRINNRPELVVIDVN